LVFIADFILDHKQCYSLTVVSVRSPVPSALSKLMLGLLKLMKRRIICRQSYWRLITWLGKLHLCEIYASISRNCGKY